MIRNIEGYWEQREVVDEIKESYTHALPGEAAFTTQAIGAPAQAREWRVGTTLLTALPPHDSMKWRAIRQQYSDNYSYHREASNGISNAV